MSKPILKAADGYKAIKSWKIPIIMPRTSVFTVQTKTWLHLLFSLSVLNMYSNSCVGFLVVTSLYIGRTSAWDYRFVWGYVYFPVLGKLEVWNSACQEGKESFLVGIILKKCSPVRRNLGVTCYFSSLTLTSLTSRWIIDTVRLVRIPNNVHSFTWLEMIQKEWDKDVFSMAITGGNSCGWKGVNNTCSIKDLTVVKWRWIRLCHWRKDGKKIYSAINMCGQKCFIAVSSQLKQRSFTCYRKYNRRVLLLFSKCISNDCTELKSGEVSSSLGSQVLNFV